MNSHLERRAESINYETHYLRITSIGGNSFRRSYLKFLPHLQPIRHFVEILMRTIRCTSFDLSLTIMNLRETLMQMHLKNSVEESFMVH